MVDNDSNELWNEDWDKYSHMLFAVVDGNQKILGTFFKEGDFKISLDNKTITGSNVMWLHTKNDNDNKYDFDNELLLSNEIQCLFHRDLKGYDKIYFVESLTYNENRELNVTYITYEEKQNEIRKLLATSRDPIRQTDDLSKEIQTAFNALQASIKQIEESKSVFKSKGGDKYFARKDDGSKIKDEELNPMINLVNKFKAFVDAFTTHPVMLKLNSLKEEQFNDLFNSIININYKESDILKNGQLTDPAEIKNIILKILFLNFNINYEHRNEEMKKELNGKFINLLEKKIPSVLVPQDDKQVIHIKDLADGFDQIVINMKKTLENKGLNYHTVNDVFDIIVKTIIEINRTFNLENDLTITNNQEQSIKIKIMDILNSLDIGNQDFIKKLNEYIQENISDKILTYVKINNFDHHYQGGQSKWNKRFDILLNLINPVNPINHVYNSMIVKYNDINEAYNYDRPDAKYYDNSNQLYKYPKQYLFGKFTKIFPPNMINSDIATQMPQIVEKVKSGKPVFVMGYGASGSGKTSSLIYFKDGGEGKKEGIIIDICKQICEGSFNRIELSTQELFSKNTKQKNENDDIKQNYDNCVIEKNLYMNCQSEKYIFTYTPNNHDANQASYFELVNHSSLTIHHPYRIKDENDITKDVFAKTIEYLIDKDRLVKATTNNPQSSRSHSFAFIKFYNEPRVNDASDGYLIVGDFAGVENTFNCESTLTIKDLLNIENSEDKTNPPKLYYGGYDTDKYGEKAREIVNLYIKNIDKKNHILMKQVFKDINEILKKEQNNLSLNIDFNNKKQIDFEKKKDIDYIFEKFNSAIGYSPSVLTKILRLNTIKNGIETDYHEHYGIYNETGDFDEYLNTINQLKSLILKKINEANDKINEANVKINEANNKKEIDEMIEKINNMINEFNKYCNKIDEFFSKQPNTIQAYEVKTDLTQKILKIKKKLNTTFNSLKNNYEDAKEKAKPKPQAQVKLKPQVQVKPNPQVKPKPAPAPAPAAPIPVSNTIITGEALIKIFQEYKNKKIDEKYFLNFIDKIIYEKYGDTLHELLNLKMANERNEKTDRDVYKKNVFDDDFKKWISNILKILKIDFIDEELKIEMQKFTGYIYDYIYNKINNINYHSIKSDNMVKRENDINIKYKTFNDIVENLDSIIGNKNLDSQKIPPIKTRINNNDKIEKTNFFEEIELKKKFENFKDDLITPSNNTINIINILTDKNNNSTEKRKQELIDIENYNFLINKFKDFNKTNIDKENKQIQEDNKQIQEDNKKIRLQNSNLKKLDFKKPEKTKSNRTSTFFLDKINKQINDIRKVQDEIVEQLENVFKSILSRLNKGYIVCSYRNFEGEFINKSLQDMREDIKNIFYEKQEDVLYISPDYVNLCLEKYCPTHSDCFKKETTIQQNNLIIKSDIFKKIFEFLNKEKENKYTIKDFYKDILISVFCVVNISPGANNPPPVPYIDINELKIALIQFEKEHKNNKKIGYYNNRNDVDYTEDKYYKISDITRKELADNLKKIYFKIKGVKFIEEIQTLIKNTAIETVSNSFQSKKEEDEHTFNELQTSTIIQVKYDDHDSKSVFQMLFEDTQLQDYDLHGRNFLYYINNNEVDNRTRNEKLIDYIKKLIETIDNNNAISAIGTLEFLDQISKYNTTQTICFLEPGQGITSEYQQIYNDEGNFMLK
jgi:hypothetical protein